MNPKDILKELMEITEEVAGEKLTEQQKKRRIAEGIVHAMPDEIKKAGAVTNPDAVVVVIDAALEIVNRLQSEIMLIMLSRPTMAASTVLTLPAMKDILDAKGIPLHEEKPQETLKDDGAAFRPTQKAGAA